MGLKGEEIVDDRVWVVKAHHPALMPGVLKFDSNKVICCVRNPLDVFLSFATLSNTMSHTAQPEFNYSTDYPEWWNWWVKEQADNHQKYFDTMLRHCNEQNKNPIYICRYEDLVSNQEAELTGVMKFLLDLDDLSGTNAERQIKQVCAKGKEASLSYRLKPTTGKFNINANKYTSEQIEVIKAKNAHLLYYFGYANHPKEQNATAFFNFTEHDPKNIERFMTYRKHNEEWIAKLAKEGGHRCEPYKINTDGVFDLFPPAVLKRV